MLQATNDGNCNLGTRIHLQGQYVSNLQHAEAGIDSPKEIQFNMQQLCVGSQFEC